MCKMFFWRMFRSIKAYLVNNIFSMNDLWIVKLDWINNIPKKWEEFVVVVWFYKGKVLMVLNEEDWRWWEFPWWTVEKWESYINAANRELFEETWIQEQFLYYVWTYINNYTNSEKTSFCHLYTYFSNIDPCTQNNKVKYFDKIPNKTTLNHEIILRVINDSKKLIQWLIDTKVCWNNISLNYEKENFFSFNDFHFWPYIKWESQLNLLPNLNWKKILDVWCWLWHNSIYLWNKWWFVTALDNSKEQINQAKKNWMIYLTNNNVEFIEWDIDLIMTKKVKYDLVVSIFSFQFVHDINLFFSKLNKLLKDKWQILLSFKNPDIYPEDIKNNFNTFWPQLVPNVWLYKWMKNWHNFSTYYNSLENIILYLKKNNFDIIQIIKPTPELKKLWEIPYQNKYYYDKLKKEKNNKYTLIIKAEKNDW